MAPDDASESRFARRITIWLSSYAVIGCLVTLVGWIAGVRRLTDWLDSGISMFANTSVVGFCAGTGLLLMLREKRWRAAAAGGLGLLTASVGAATLVEHFFGVSFGIDTLLVKQPWGGAAVAPGRMGPPASLCFTLIGIAIWLRSRNSVWRKAVPWIGVFVSGAAVLALVGYGFNADPLFAVARLTGIAMQTGTIILALGMAVIASVPDLEPVRTLRERSAAGLLLRKALPFTTLLPIALGWLFLKGREAEWIDRGMGTAMLVLLLVSIFSILLWLCAAAIAAHEKASRSSEQRLAQLISLMPAGVYTCDGDGRITFFNRRAAGIWGTTPVVGADLQRFCGSFRLLQPDGTPIPHDQSPMAAAVRSAIAIRNREAIIERPDGSRITASVNIDPLFDSDGKHCGAINVFQDVSDAKRIASQQQAVYELAATVNRAAALPDICNAALTALCRIMESERVAILLASDNDPKLRFAASRGLSDEYRAGLELHSPWIDVDCGPQLGCINDTRTAVLSEPLRVTMEREQVRAAITVPLTYQQRLLGRLLIQYDNPRAFGPEEVRPAEAIANQVVFALERHRASEALERLVNERTASLRSAVAQLEEFSYTVSHDLRAPLRGMKVYAEALLEDFAALLPEEARNYLDRIASTAERLDKMILDVLTFSRISRAEIHLERVPMERLLRRIVEDSPGMHSPQAEIEIAPLPDVLGHEPSLTQAFSNLLHNAVKFVPPNVIPRIRIHSERNNGHVRFWIEDNGIGIDPKVQHRLFNMFERVHPNLKYDGTGVGLAIVRKAIERMGGTVGLESDGLKGSRFWIEIRPADTPPAKAANSG